MALNQQKAQNATNLMGAGGELTETAAQVGVRPYLSSPDFSIVTPFPATSFAVNFLAQFPKG